MRAEHLMTALLIVPGIFFLGVWPALHAFLNALPMERTFSWEQCFVYASPLLIWYVSLNIAKAMHSN